MELNIGQITDPYLRENMETIEESFNSEDILDGGLRFFEINIKGAQDYVVRHGLGYPPKDMVVTQYQGASYTVKWNEATDDSLVITTTGDVYLRCLLGALN